MDNQTLQIQLTALRTGDPAALEAIYEGMKTPLYTVILRITRREALAEEVLQELFLKLYRSPPGETVRNPRAYLFQMARNLAIDCLKAQRPEDTPEAEPPGRDWGDLDVRPYQRCAAFPSGGPGPLHAPGDGALALPAGPE